MTIAELQQQLKQIYGYMTGAHSGSNYAYGDTGTAGMGGWKHDQSYYGSGNANLPPSLWGDYWKTKAYEYGPDKSPMSASTIASNWQDLFEIDFGGSDVQLSDLEESINPVTYKELMGARYGSMRPGMESGTTTLSGELSRNLAKIKSGGFESSGFTDRARQEARDVYGKKASDVLFKEATKRSDYMGSLLDRATAEKEIFSGWSSLG